MPEDKKTGEKDVGELLANLQQAVLNWTRKNEAFQIWSAVVEGERAAPVLEYSAAGPDGGMVRHTIDIETAGDKGAFVELILDSLQLEWQAGLKKLAVAAAALDSHYERPA